MRDRSEGYDRGVRDAQLVGWCLIGWVAGLAYVVGALLVLLLSVPTALVHALWSRYRARSADRPRRRTKQRQSWGA